jgi:hypothetical protein
MFRSPSRSACSAVLLAQPFVLLATMFIRLLIYILPTIPCSCLPRYFWIQVVPLCNQCNYIENDTADGQYIV